MIRYLKMFYSFLVTVFFYLFDTGIMVTVRKPKKFKGVALIRMDSIGDFILWLDAAKEFRNLYPDTPLTLIANSAWSDLAGLLLYWDDVIPVNRKKITRHLLYRFQILSNVRKRGFEIAIHPMYSREYLRGDSLVRLTGSMCRIGSFGNLSNMTSLQKLISDKWYTKLIPATAHPLMELQRNAEFLRGLGHHNFTAGIPSLPRLTALPQKLNIQQAYFIISPGASWSGRQWPPENFGELLSKLSAFFNWLPILCGSREERSLCDKVIAFSGVQALNWAGETSLPELVEIIRKARFLVANETSFIHIAAAVGTPTVCVLGGGHYGRFLPYIVEKGKRLGPVVVVSPRDCYHCNWQCSQPHEKNGAVPCISTIGVHRVFEAVVLKMQQTDSG